ncbi:helix-turn-helix transcriptional regulator [Nocardia seriolae]|uniref:helix-turn-helix transcriptional regulator n=1 Tax=Nocardia seriolae TaxID=37332 RepID=UPI0009E0424C|nr:LuxR family transcriptional regulator [Nocardia seriolae]MTJ65749.1 AAA family ATPase [Nocardia seriolae]MTJ71601.1 AAA family ATPase [Nocardia seriolae]MTJ86318.1 AAA family ATPase [Nocardia seriolae]MTK30312.1 AAA family ATPase [Nocardia seriolae]MTK43746.1 AAA family ATPase [Nocardia seriolae]
MEFVGVSRIEVTCYVREIGELLGREREQADLSRLLTEARGGHGLGMVLWGEPGIGKTALLRDTEQRATDFRSIACRGFPAESELDFAALHELLLPLTDRIAALPAPQARALASALGRDTRPADGFLVGAALVTLLASVAAEQPLLLLVVDDAQWVDAATARALSFAMRRLTGSRVALLAATRDCPAVSVWQALPVLPIDRLADAPARRLLARRVGELGDPRAVRILRVADGNPLALRELPVDAEEFAGIGWGPVPFGPKLRFAFAARLAEVSEPVRTLLTVVAAEDRGMLDAVTTAASELGVTAADWQTALDSGLVAVTDGRVEMRQRLLCGAAYDAAAPARRRAVHLALAAALPGADHAELRTWHLAAVVDGSNPELALALSNGTDRVYRNAGALAAAAVLRRAAAITPDPAVAGARLASAARFAWEGGDLESARRLLALADQRTTPPETAAASGGLAGLLELFVGEPARARELLLRDAAAIDERDSAIEPRDKAIDAHSTAIGVRDKAIDMRETAIGVRDSAAAGGLRLLADRVNWVLGADEDPAVLAELDDIDAESSPAAAARLLLPAMQLVEWGLAGRALEPYLAVAAGLRHAETRAAAFGLLPQVAIVQLACGRWEAGEQTLDEAFDLTRGSGPDNNILAECWAVRTRLAAQRGETEVVAQGMERTLAVARRHEIPSLTGLAYWNHGFHALTTGDAEAAYRRLRGLYLPGHEAAHPTVARLAALDMVEAACRTGRFDDAAAGVELITAWAEHSRARWALAAADIGRALLAEEDRAEYYYRRALALSEPRPTNFARARAQLLYGKWLRRVRRRRDAAEQLRSAADAFEFIGASAWVGRARNELELTGTGAKPAGGATPLTAQESQVARLAAQGLTNREIGAELFLSPRTVGHHMSRILEKLGLTGRSELRGIDFDNGMRLMRPR